MKHYWTQLQRRSNKQQCHEQPSSTRPVSNYCGGNIISGHCTMAGPGWTTHRAQGQLRSTAPVPAPARDQNSFHKLSHHGEYLRLYLYIWARYAVVAAGWVATLRPPVSSSRQIFRSRTLARQRCGGAAAAVSTLETLNNLLILAPLSSTRLPAVQCSLLTRPHVHRFTTIEYLSE